MSRTRTVKRNVVIHYLKCGYRIEGLEVKKGSDTVMDIPMTMKRWFIKTGLISAVQQNKQ